MNINRNFILISKTHNSDSTRFRYICENSQNISVEILSDNLELHSNLTSSNQEFTIDIISSKNVDYNTKLTNNSYVLKNFVVNHYLGITYNFYDSSSSNTICITVSNEQANELNLNIGSIYYISFGFK